MDMNKDDSKKLKALKFKHGEYLIGDLKSNLELINYLKSNFKVNDISRKPEEIEKIDAFGFFKKTLENINAADHLDPQYLIIKKEENEDMEGYFLDENLNSIYLVISLEHEKFITNSKLLETELILFRGLSREDILNDSPRLFSYLLQLEKQAEIEKLKEINKNFISPEDKKSLLEKYIMEEILGKK